MDKVFIKGLTLLEVLVNSEVPRGVTELADELKLNKSNIHRLLQALVHRGYVTKHPMSGRYHCTLKLWQMGSLLSNRIDVKTVARPFMMTLSTATQESAHLSVLDGARVVYLDKVDSPQPIGAYSTVGGHAPPHCVATGKALLACLPNAEVRRVVTSLPRFTDRTITDIDQLLEELQRIREQGYALNRGEWRAGVRGTAAPIFDASTRPCAAVGISGPATRLTIGRLRDVAPKVVETAASISRALGYARRPGSRA